MTKKSLKPIKVILKLGRYKVSHRARHTSATLVGRFFFHSSAYCTSFFFLLSSKRLHLLKAIINLCKGFTLVWMFAFKFLMEVICRRYLYRGRGMTQFHWTHYTLKYSFIMHLMFILAWLCVCFSKVGK